MAGLLALGVLLAACTTPTTVVPTQTPSPSATPRPFTIVTTGAVTSADPAVATGYTDSMVVTSVYQRLMMVLPDTGELKPDAATDCLFTSKLVYECTLPDDLSFHNGHVLDSSDVRFSIQRALRLDAAGTSIGLLSALKQIETPDAHTVRFELSWPDNQFGYALAGQAASIVDEEAFDPDSALPLETLPVGSGPYEVQTITDEAVSFTRFEKYLGPKTGLLADLTLQIVADSVAAEAVIADGTADAVWRSLDAAALQRVTDEIAGSSAKATATGFTRYALPGTRITQLVWNENSRLRRNARLREGVAKALQPDRTLDSIVPVGVADHATSFLIGGRTKLPHLDGSRIIMTLGYSPSAPGQADQASIIRDRIEGLGGVSVRLVSGGTADLYLTDFPAWVNNATGWLQRYLERPLSASADKLELLETRARTTSGESRTAVLTEIQLQAAADATVLPVSQGDGILFLGKDVKLIGDAFGSGQMLGLWGFVRG
ncbi:ABC transporter substrate-binding protein [Propionicimonas sp.]|uniref:ABC transporter substrate-binding protein n=1 Tax=Propionicimonas sp. TaxID=1955623 RepID=UPI0039E240FA